MVEIISQQKRHKIKKGHFRRLLEKAMAFYGLSESYLNLVFTGNAFIRRLNRIFRKKDRPTDVLSFPLSEKGADGHYYLGDIVISVPQAYAQCGRKKGSLEKELEKLTIHGFLHLLGYDHGPQMDREETRLRAYLGLK